MNPIIKECTRLISLPAGDPSSSTEIIVIWALALIAHTAGVIITGKSVRSTMAYSVPRALIITLLSIGSMILALAASNIYIIPLMGNSSLRGLAPAVMIIIAIAGIAGLTSQWIHKTKYSKALVTLLISIACAIAMAYATRSAFTGARRGKSSALQMKRSTEEASNFKK